MKPLAPTDPQFVGRYMMLGRLGAGGMGRVYLGRSPGGRLVAVKVVHDELASDEDFRTRFRKEISAMRRVGGFWTATVVDADPDADVPWLATAYIAGPSPAVSLRRWRRSMRRVWCTGTLSPRTCCCPATARG
jgi:serine/threonine protein kinase